MHRHACLPEKTDQVLLRKLSDQRKDPGNIVCIYRILPACFPAGNLFFPGVITGTVQEQIGQITSAVTGCVYLLPNLLIFFKNRDPASRLRSRDCGHASGSSAADHGNPAAGIFHGIRHP